ncbi:translesion error-prone DNA polymerase V autoproteolytic subunit [Rouxiella sp. Mn2063]|uniref:translesion error-prone DNA polymerase V autoproteolytic subunit n=1 Tax=Rouxiella sp. Mn2063 TaxID=3395262 RepID=UPI003BC09809
MICYKPTESQSESLLPLFLERVPCGFPSPAQDYVESRLDLNKFLVQHPSATYFVRVSGHSMTDANINEGDLLVVDSALTAVHDNIVVASVNGEFTVKRLCTKPRLQLLAMNPSYAPITFDDDTSLEIFGVVTFIIYAAR